MIRLIVIEQENSMRNFLETSCQEGYEIIYLENPAICSIMEADTECKKEFPCGDIFIIGYNTNYVNGIELVEEQGLKGCKLNSKNKAVLLPDSDGNIDINFEALECAVFSMPIETEEMNTWLSECQKRLNL